jgi:hypothetical protein
MKNEEKNINKWLDYALEITDAVYLLDTGSTDSTFEIAKERMSRDKRITVEQKIFSPWRFDVARNYNLAMVPSDTSWVMSPDLDEIFSLNTITELEKNVRTFPNITNLSCARIDFYSKDHCFEGKQTGGIGSNKIFRYNSYMWFSRIYEHVRFIPTEKYPVETEIYSFDIALIHDQDFRKQERSELYIKMLTEVWEEGPLVEPDYSWCMWFLVNHYFRDKNIEMFLKTSFDYLTYNDDRASNNYLSVLNVLEKWSIHTEIPQAIRKEIHALLKRLNPKYKYSIELS